MTKTGWIATAIIVAGAAGSSAAQAQASPPQEVQILGSSAATVPASGSDWKALGRSANSVSLLDGGSVTTEGDEVHVKIARVPMRATAGDYSHVVDTFAVRCDARQSHLISSADALENGEPSEALAADEDWFDVPPGSFDESLLQVACGRSVLNGNGFPTIKAYIDAGRP